MAENDFENTVFMEKTVKTGLFSRFGYHFYSLNASSMKDIAYLCLWRYCEKLRMVIFYNKQLKKAVVYGKNGRKKVNSHVEIVLFRI
jgi:hypothetical protein